MRPTLLAMLPLVGLPLVATAAAPSTSPGEHVRSSVVRLVVQDGAGRERARGSGFFVSSDGRVVTSRRLLHGAEQVRAVLADGDERRVLGLLAEDEDTDVALLRVEGSAYAPLQLSEVPAGDGARVVVPSHTHAGGAALATVRTAGGPSSADAPPLGHVVTAGGVAPAHLVPATGRWPRMHLTELTPAGAPVLSLDGSVVGVVQTPGVAIPADAVRALLVRVGPGAVPQPFGTTSRGSPLLVLGIIAAVGLVLASRRRHQRRGPSLRG